MAEWVIIVKSLELFMTTHTTLDDDRVMVVSQAGKR